MPSDRHVLIDFQGDADRILIKYEQALAQWENNQIRLKEARAYEDGMRSTQTTRYFKRVRMREAKANLTPIHNPINALKVEVYQLIRTYERQECLNELQKFILDRDGRPPNLRPWVNPFTVGMQLLFGPAGEVISMRSRYRYAVQMLFADEHEIEPEMLIGFLYQVGGLEVIPRQS